MNFKTFKRKREFPVGYESCDANMGRRWDTPAKPSTHRLGVSVATHEFMRLKCGVAREIRDFGGASAEIATSWH